MKKVVLQMLILAGFAFSATKIAVIGAEIDQAAVGLQKELTEADLNHITREISRLAAKEFPKSDYVIMTDETYLNMGDAVLQDCDGENCYIAIGKKIGADYIVKSIVGKFRSTFTLSVEIYDTKNGNLFGSSDLIDAKDIGSLIPKMRQIVPILFKELIAGGLQGKTKNNAEAYYKSGNEYFAKGEHDIAISEYTEAIRLNPKFAEAYSNRGRAYGIKGDNDIALSDFNEAIRLNPKLAWAYAGRCAANVNKGYDDRISDCNQAIRLDPKLEKAYYNRGRLYGSKGDYDKAISDFNESIRLDSRWALTYYMRGLMYSNKKEHDRAISDFNEAIRLDPKFVEAYSSRGFSYAMIEDSNKANLDKSIKDYSEAIRLNPDDAEKYVYRGLVYEGKEDYYRAIKDYTEAIKLIPNYAWAYYTRGLAYGKKGDKTRAIADLESVLQIDPNYADTREILEKIKENSSAPEPPAQEPSTYIGEAWSTSLVDEPPAKIDPQVGEYRPFKNSFWVALALDVIGAGFVEYGLYKNGEVRSKRDEYRSKSAKSGADSEFDNDWQKVEDAKTARNVSYVLGSIFFAAGIGVHIWF